MPRSVSPELAQTRRDRDERGHGAPSRHARDSRHHHDHHRHHRRQRERSQSPRRRSPRRDGGSEERRGRSSRRERSPLQAVGKGTRRRTDAGERERERKKGEMGVEKLPFSARRLGKADLPVFGALFAEYLSLQKQREIEDMQEREVRGRWKSFVGKWNRGELSEGWYDPDFFQRIKERDPEPLRFEGQRNGGAGGDGGEESDQAGDQDDEDEDEDEDDGYGPALPSITRRAKAGASIPTFQDLSMRDELAAESREADREALRLERKADRKLQKDRLEELVPRAEAGTRERKLEKKKEVNEKMRQFRERSPGGTAAEVGDKELMGGGDEDSVEAYRREKERQHKRKSERDLWREEQARAKKEELDAKRRAWQEREDQTVSMLKEIVKQRFG